MEALVGGIAIVIMLVVVGFAYVFLISLPWSKIFEVVASLGACFGGLWLIRYGVTTNQAQGVAIGIIVAVFGGWLAWKSIREF